MKMQDMIRRVIEIGRQTGFVTFDQINELMPSTTAEPEDIVTLFEALNAEGIQITEE